MLCLKLESKWNECIEMDLTLINILRITNLFIHLISRYFKYLTFFLVNLIILLKSCCILIRHIIFPLLGFDSNRTAIALLSLLSEFLVLLCLAILYRPQMESSIYLSSSADDSDYFVIVSVILTKYLY